MLSSSGSTQGLASMNGQDLELFKKTKDRGLIK
jgi:preprotein translocase subunit SecG